MEGGRTRPEGVLLCRTQEGYTLQDGNRGRLDPEAAYVFLKECLKEGVTQIRLEEGCYRDLPDTEADTFQRELWGQGTWVPAASAPSCRASRRYAVSASTSSFVP